MANSRYHQSYLEFEEGHPYASSIVKNYELASMYKENQNIDTGSAKDIVVLGTYIIES